MVTTLKDNRNVIIDFKKFWALEHMGVATQELEDLGFLKTY